MHSHSTAMISDAKPYAYESGLRAIKDHLDRLGLKANVTNGGDTNGVYKTEYEVIGNPKVSIIIPNKDGLNYLKKCIDSILKLTKYENYEIVIVENNSENKSTFDYYKQLEENKKIKILIYPEKGFNYSKIINYGVKNTESDFILQLNNDTELLTPNWLEQFIGFAQRNDVGAVGARLYYEDMSIQHAGIVIGIGGVAANMLSGLPKNTFGYFGKECLTQNMSAVTGACLFTRRAIYEEVGYMDEEKFKVAFNDVDFCLKIREKEYLIIYDPYIKLVHYESKTRGYEDTVEKKERFDNEVLCFLDKWAHILESGDPYYNINLTLDKSDYSVDI
jgi:GT2 family glycosyltransferase